MIFDPDQMWLWLIEQAEHRELSSEELEPRFYASAGTNRSAGCDVTHSVRHPTR
jgi:hypothetical protein